MMLQGHRVVYGRCFLPGRGKADKRADIMPADSNRLFNNRSHIHSALRLKRPAGRVNVPDRLDDGRVACTLVIVGDFRF